MLDTVERCATITFDRRSGTIHRSLGGYCWSGRKKPYDSSKRSIEGGGAEDFPGTEWADKGRGFGFVVTPRREPRTAPARRSSPRAGALGPAWRAWPDLSHARRAGPPIDFDAVDALGGLFSASLEQRSAVALRASRQLQHRAQVRFATAVLIHADRRPVDFGVERKRSWEMPARRRAHFKFAPNRAAMPTVLPALSCRGAHAGVASVQRRAQDLVGLDLQARHTFATTSACQVHARHTPVD